MLDVPSATNYMSGGMTSGNEGFTSGMEDTIVKERKKKRTKKSVSSAGLKWFTNNKIVIPKAV